MSTLDVVVGAKGVEAGRQKISEIEPVRLGALAQRLDQPAAHCFHHDHLVGHKQVPARRLAETSARVAPKGIDRQQIDRHLHAGPRGEVRQ